jgi:hypothetical protein
MSEFTRRYRTQALRTYAYREGLARRPWFRLMTSIKGYTYLRVGPVVVIRDGWRVSLRRAT